MLCNLVETKLNHVVHVYAINRHVWFLVFSNHSRHACTAVSGCVIYPRESYLGIFPDVGEVQMASVWMVWLALVVVQLGFGAYGVIVSKFAKDNKADPLMFNLIRTGGCFPVLFIAAIILEKRIQIPSLR